MESSVSAFMGNTVANVKIATLILGVVNIGFIGHSFVPVGREEAYLSAVIICFIISFLWTMAIIVGLIKQESDVMKKADMMYHICASLFYLITLIIFFVSLIDYGNIRYLWERIMTFLIGIGMTLLYALGGYLFYKAE